MRVKSLGAVKTFSRVVIREVNNPDADDEYVDADGGLFEGTGIKVLIAAPVVQEVRRSSR